MNNDTLLTTPLTQDANQIIDAINQRTREIQKMLTDISVSKKIVQKTARALTIISAIFAVATVPMAIYTLSLQPLVYGAAALAGSIVSLGFLFFLDIQSPAEAIIKRLWNELFCAIKQSNTASIVNLCETLQKKKRDEHQAFVNTIADLPIDIADRFFQKTLFASYLLNALKAIDNEKHEDAKSFAHLSLSSFIRSGFPKEAADSAHAIVNKPGRVTNRLIQCGCPETIEDLEAFIVMMSCSLDDEYLHDFVRL